MNPNTYHGEFHSTDVYFTDYLPDQTFNFLILMVCFTETFPNGIIICKDGVALHL